MSIYASTNPTEWGQLDGVYIDDVAPPPSVVGVPANTAILIGQFERGPVGVPQSIGSVGQLFEQYGNNLAYSGLVSLQNKQFGLLKIVRVAAAAAVNAVKAFNDAAAHPVVSFTALWPGVYGNLISVTIAAGSTSGSKYTVHDGNPGAVWPDEVYDNVAVTLGTVPFAAIFANSNLVTGTLVNATYGEPVVAAATALATGADGTVADTDYQTAITASQPSYLGNITFLDTYTTARNGYLKVSMAATTDRMAILCNPADVAVAAAVTDVANYRDAAGRLIYAYPYLYTTINGASTLVNPASFYASLLSQIAPNIDPAYAANTQYLAGVESLSRSLQRSDYITLAAAGISAFENDVNIGMKIKSGVVTQIADSSKIMIFRRRMTDFLTQSLAKYLTNYQNAPNSQVNRTNVNGAITAFNRQIESDQLVPRDTEVTSGKASLIDTKSLNTDDSIAAGYFKVIYKRRIYSSMRFIVLQTQIGESVVVTEANG